MSGICDRCNERTSHIVNIAHLPELAAVAHLGYRLVCAECYDDLVAEANEAVGERDEDRRAEPRVKVSLKARVEGNTSHLDAFSDEMNVEEISPSGLRLHTAREVEPGALLKVSVPAHDFEATAIVESVWSDGGQRSVGLKLVEPTEGWQRLWQNYAAQE
ncbi:MAG: PilZ domain-containing protein [Blastocatellia bacterium]